MAFGGSPFGRGLFEEADSFFGGVGMSQRQAMGAPASSYHRSRTFTNAHGQGGVALMWRSGCGALAAAGKPFFSAFLRLKSEKRPAESLGSHQSQSMGGRGSRQVMMSSSSSSFGGGGGFSRSVSSHTKVVNGRTVTVTEEVYTTPDGVTHRSVTHTEDDGRGNRHGCGGPVEAGVAATVRAAATVSCEHQLVLGLAAKKTCKEGGFYAASCTDVLFVCHDGLL
ncbi:hypothetical protein cyc_05198 [Cyclospora cayetanensis]|uniref:Uncharacterized protein n=1 Tax=Cyclospora cayetanensis TaxID=88456 RepID=A0A1D3CSN4_9EIME|nr:hypothetical protein cyc_05198 [Cyclospora cayetanensis]